MILTTSRRLAVAGAVALAATLALATVAGAAFPLAGNGRIAYERVVGSQSDVWTMNADGSGQALLISGSPDDVRDPAFSPLGNRIAFIRHEPGNPELWIANADGSGAQASRGVQPAGDNSAVAIDRRTAFAHWMRILWFTLLLVVMVWKPGA